MYGFLEAPYPMIPTCIVPLVIGSHVLLFGRLRRERLLAMSGQPAPGGTQQFRRA